MELHAAVEDLRATLAFPLQAAAAVLVLGCAASAARAQSAADLLGMLPAPATGDCNANPAGAARRAHDQAMQAFQRAYSGAKERQKAASKALMDAVTANPTAAMLTNARQMSALNSWLSQPGHLVVDQTGKALLDPPVKAAWAAEASIFARAEACEKSEKCDAHGVLNEIAPIQQKLAGELARRWPLFLDSLRKALAYDQRPLPAGLDPRALAVRMQIDAQVNTRYEDLGQAALIADTYACIETARMSFAMGSTH